MTNLFYLPDGAKKPRAGGLWASRGDKRKVIGSVMGMQEVWL